MAGFQTASAATIPILQSIDETLKKIATDVRWLKEREQRRAQAEAVEAAGEAKRPRTPE